MASVEQNPNSCLAFNQASGSGNKPQLAIKKPTDPMKDIWKLFWTCSKMCHLSSMIRLGIDPDRTRRGCYEVIKQGLEKSESTESALFQLLLICIKQQSLECCPARFITCIEYPSELDAYTAILPYQTFPSSCRADLGIYPESTISLCGTRPSNMSLSLSFCQPKSYFSARHRTQLALCED